MAEINDRGRITRDITGWRYETPPPCKWLGYQKLSVSSASVPLTVPDGADSVRIRCEGGDVRWRIDGEDPLSTDGELIQETDPVLVLQNATIEALYAFRAIRAGLTNGTLHITYYQLAGG